MAKQDKKKSFLEAIYNSLIGTIVGMTTAWFIYPLFGIEFTFIKILQTSVIFTIVSISRTYYLRRLFNSLSDRQKPLGSFIESGINIALGSFLSFLIVLYIFPLFDMGTSTHGAFGMTLTFTAIGLLKTFLVRRYFENK